MKLSTSVIAWAIGALQLALTLPWLYRYGAGEPDSIAMITGIYQAMLKGTFFNEPLYMLMGQPLYYGLFFSIPGLRNLQYDHLALVMNLISWLMSGFSTVLIFCIVTRISGKAAGLLSALILISSPTVFEWSTYAHPVTISNALVLLAMSFFQNAVTRKAEPLTGSHRFNIRNILQLAAAAVAAGLAVGIRADAIVLFHLFPLLPLMAWATNPDAPVSRQIKPVVVGVATAIVAALIGLLCLFPFTAPTANEATSPLLLLATLRRFFHLISLRDGLLELAFGIGPFGALLFLLAAVVAVVRQKWQILLISALVIIPPLIYAMGNPQPARRFLPGIYALTLALGLLSTWTFGRQLRLAAALGLVVLLGNFLLLPFIGWQITRSGISVKDHSFLYRLTSSLWAHHRTNQQYIMEIEKHLETIRSKATGNDLLLGHFSHVQFLIASLSRDKLPATYKVVAQDPGLILTQVQAGDERFVVAEYYPTLTSSTLPAVTGKIYNLRDSPADTVTTATIINAAPVSGKFTMWFRGNV